MSPAAVVIDTAEVFRIKNDDETVLHLSLGSRSWDIEPGGSALVPFEVIRINWGDPRSKPGVYGKFADGREKGWINKREDEIKRLGVWYGTYATDAATLNDTEWPIGDKAFGTPRTVPHKVRVQTEGGEEIILPAFDTEGRSYRALNNEPKDLTDEVTYRQDLEQRMEDLQAEMRATRQMGTEDDTEVDGGGPAAPAARSRR